MVTNASVYTATRMNTLFIEVQAQGQLRGNTLQKDLGCRTLITEGARLRQARAGEALGEQVAERAELVGVAVRGQQRQRLAPAVQRARLHQACATRASAKAV